MMQITGSPSTLHVTITMFNTGFVPVVDETKYPGMGYIVVDEGTWRTGFALWHQSVMAEGYDCGSKFGYGPR